MSIFEISFIVHSHQARIIRVKMSEIPLFRSSVHKILPEFLVFEFYFVESQGKLYLVGNAKRFLDHGDSMRLVMDRGSSSKQVSR